MKSKEHAELVVTEEGPPWYLEEIGEPWELTGPRPGVADELQSLAKRASDSYQDQVSRFEAGRKISRSDREWLKTVSSSGTASDRTAAFLLQIQEAPFYHGLEYLGRLLAVAKAPSRHQSFLAIDSLKDAFLVLLPPDRALVYLKQRKWTNPASALSLRTLALVHFEDGLKKAYADYLKLVEAATQDQIPYWRERAIRILWGLASGSLEQSNGIIALLVNKLGDPKRKIASRVVYYLQEIVKTHHRRAPMAATIVAQIQRLIQRPSVPEKAQYYALTFLSQLVLSPRMADLITQLMAIYLDVFKAVVIPSLFQLPGKRAVPQTVNLSRAARIILTGINRALPYYKGDVMALQNDLVEPIKKMARVAGSAALIQALGLYSQIVSLTGMGWDNVVDILVDFLAGPLVVRETNSHSQLFALVCKLAADPNLSTNLAQRLVKALVSSSLRIASETYCASVLSLLDDLLRSSKPALNAMITLPPDDPSDTSACLFELNLLCCHYSPLIASYARSLLSGSPVENPVNPFNVLTSQHFLDELIAYK